MKIIQREQIGTEPGLAFVSRRGGVCGLEQVEHPIFAGDRVRGSNFRTRRVQLGVSLRDAAKTLGVSAAELSSVELGEADFEDWDAAIATLEAGR